MLQTIEVQIDANGHIQPVEPLVRLPVGRGLLTLLDDNQSLTTAGKQETGNNFNDLFGIITATNTASLDDMKQAIYQRAARNGLMTAIDTNVLVCVLIDDSNLPICRF